MTAARSLTAQQRIGIGIVAMFYGEMVTVPLTMLSILMRFPGNWATLAHHTRFTVRYLISVSAFDALVAAVTWLIFGSAIVVLWRLESMKRQLWIAYVMTIPLAAMAPMLLAAPLWTAHRKDASFPTLTKPLFLELFLFMLLTSVIAINRYIKMSTKAEALVAAGAAFRY